MFVQRSAATELKKVFGHISLGAAGPSPSWVGFVLEFMYIFMFKIL